MSITTEEAIEMISRVTAVKYSEEQRNIMHHNGGMCILACAGSGKTTILTHLLAKRILTGEIEDVGKLLCTTYSRAGAQEMDDRINKLLQKLNIKSHVAIKTLHAFYLMILERFGYSTNVMDEGLRFKYIAEVCKELKLSLKYDDLKLISSLLSYQINNLMSDEALVKSYVYTIGDLVSEEMYSKIRAGYSKRKQDGEVIDFDDMQLFIYVLLVKQGREDIVDYCRSMFTNFYVDEAQDVSKIQFEILRKLISDPRKIVFIGDDDQCIYEWRGADPRILLNICGYYDIQRFILSTNYRCRGEIVDHAAIGIRNNSNRAEKTMKPFLAEGGKIQICDTGSDNIYEMAKYAFVYIKSLITGGVDPSNIAVLSRNNMHLAILNSLLFKSGINCDMTQDMKFSKSYIYKDIKSVLKLAENDTDYNNTRSNLWRVCTFLGVKGSKFIGDLQASSGMNLSDAIGYVLTSFEKSTGICVKIKYKNKYNVPATMDARTEVFCGTLNSTSVEDLITLYKLLQLGDINLRSVGFLNMYIKSTAFLYKSCDIRRILMGYVKYTIDLITSTGVEKTKKLFTANEQYENGKMAMIGSKICLCTMHGAKGREWDHVLLFAADNVSFPSFEGITSMLDGGISISDISASIDEGRRLHYVAMTRAKKDLTIFTSKDNISVYTLESMGIFHSDDNTNNMHIVSMARQGRVYQDLLDEAQKKLFGDESKFKRNIDISGFTLGSNEDYKATEQTSFSGYGLDEIETGQPMFNGEDEMGV